MSKIHYEKKTRLHLQVRDRIRNMVIRNGSRRGDPLPSYRDMTERFKVSLVTVQRAMDELIKEGIVYGWPGRGTFVGRELSPAGRKLTQIGLVLFCSRRLFFSSPYLMEIFQGVMVEAEVLNVDVRIFSIKSEGGLAPRQISDSGVDGVILLGVANDPFIGEVAQEQSPLVVADHCTQKVPADYIVCDNHAAARGMVQHLIRLGHRHIAYMDGWSTDTVPGLGENDPVVESSDVVERREGYLLAMQEAGLASHAVVYAVNKSSPEVSVPQAVDAWSRAAARPTAIVAYGSGEAETFIHCFRHIGVRVPQDVSVAALAGAGADANGGDHSRTYYRMHFVEMGHLAIKKLSERCSQLRPMEASIHRVGLTFLAGNTTAPPAP